MDATLDAAGPGRPAAAPTGTPPCPAAAADSPLSAHPRAEPGPADAARACGTPPPAAGAAPSGGAPADAGPARPAVTELRLSAFGPHRAAAFPLGPVTLFTGPSGSGKTQALDAYRALAALASGATLREAFPDPGSRVPERALPDGGGRRGFRLGCTVDGPSGPVRLDLAVQAEPVLRIAGERLSQDGRILLATALRDPRRRTVEAAWFTGGTVGVTRAPMPDDRLGTGLLPLRVAGSTAGQRRVLAAAEQVVVALRAVFACDPDPGRMRAPVPAGEGRLRTDCGNLADVLRRTRHECGTRHALLAGAARTGCTGPVAGLDVRAAAGGAGLVAAVLDRGPGRPATGLDRLGAGELRFLALALVLLTGPGVLEVDPAAELLSARQALTVLADGLDRDLDRRQAAELLRLALLSGGRGHIRLVAAVGEDTAGTGRGVPGVSVVDLSP
ncbi:MULTISPECIES: ATP-binding protein [Streptomyces]|uniref:ATP-binding protein n=1 Tax=Streptomyces TaxID=1883 RepID=UPI000F7754FE|nr:MULTISPECIES: ATP-binding protein [Streptomyces]RST05815.1 ATP-binding protein [Streptomyces sp. WAC07149]GLX21317.1 biotin transporter BioY [Streptomyces lavendulae subsp. lavendulae]GLX27835.1 biotin transporter BioY [Streptomyces lavendulae subsp. lavendulae]